MVWQGWNRHGTIFPVYSVDAHFDWIIFENFQRLSFTGFILQMGQAKAKSLKLSLGLLCWWQRPKRQATTLLPPKMSISRKLNWKRRNWDSNQLLLIWDAGSQAMPLTIVLNTLPSLILDKEFKCLCFDLPFNLTL